MKSLVKLMFFLALFFVSIQVGFSRGDKIIPQIVDGPGWATKLDLTNVSTVVGITAMNLSFYHNDGTPWSLQTTLGTGSSYTLSIGARQTLRVETSGASQSVQTGYAVIYDEETEDSDFSEDYVLGISVYYVVLDGSKVADAVTVSVPQPTALAKMPVEMNDAQGIYSGLVVANWAGASNYVQIELYKSDTSGTTADYTTSFTLASGEQKAMFLDNDALFPGLKSFKGMAEISAAGPVALLGLLQTRAGDNTPRYATLVPVDMESLRRNSYMITLQADTDADPFMPLDLDNMVSDFHRVTGIPDGFSWDLEYRYGTTANPSDTTARFLQAFNNATILSLGTYNDDGFKGISLPYLKSLTYPDPSNPIIIDLSGSNLYLYRTFAVRTDLNNYAKIRIVWMYDATTTNGRALKDIVLEVVVYR